MASQVVEPLSVGEFVRAVGCDQMGRADCIGRRGRIYEVSVVLGEVECKLQFVDDGDKQIYPPIDGEHLERLVGEELAAAIKEDEDGKKEEEIAETMARSEPLAEGEYVRVVKCWGQSEDIKSYVGKRGRVIADPMEYDGNARVRFMDDGSRCLTDGKNLQRLVGQELAAVKNGEHLVLAVKDGRLDDANVLLAIGATVETMDIEGEPAAIWAVEKGYMDGLNVLIAANANIHALNSRGSTAVMTAADGGKIECLGILISANADVNIRSKGGVTAMSLVAKKGYTDCLQSLTAAKANLDTQDSTLGWTPTMSAARKGHVDCVRVLIAAKANLEVQARQQPAGMTAMMAAAMEGHYSCLEALIASEANVNAQGEDGWTASLFAAGRGHVDCLRVLIVASANLEAQATKSKKTALILSSESGNVDSLLALIAAKADVNAQERNRVTATIQAALNDRPSCVAALISAKADLNIQTGGSSGMTALGWAKSEGNGECIKMLEQAGANQ